MSQGIAVSVDMTAMSQGIAVSVDMTRDVARPRRFGFDGPLPSEFFPRQLAEPQWLPLFSRTWRFGTACACNVGMFQHPSSLSIFLGWLAFLVACHTALASF